MREGSIDRICLAAQDEFGALGFSEANVRKIALKANVSKQLLYHYFPRKEDLYQEVVKRLPSSFQYLINSDFENQSPIVAIEDFVARYSEFYQTNRNVGRIYIDQIIRDGAELAIGGDFRILKRTVLAKLATVLERGQKDGDFREDVSPEGLLYLSTVLCLGYTVMTSPLDILGLPVPELESRAARGGIAATVIVSYLKADS